MQYVRRSLTDIPRLHTSLPILLLLLFLIQPFQPVFNTGVAQAAAVPWSEPNGTGNGFDWQNGQSLYGLFGNPNLVGGNTFVFAPDNFIAISSNGQPVEVSDTLTFDLIAHPNILITQIQITEFGSYGLLDSGLVDLVSTLQTQNLVNQQIQSVGLVPNPAMPVYFGTGSWDAAGTLQFAGWTHLRVTLSNNLIAIGDIGSTAYIQKDFVGSAVAITIIPEPATIAMLSIGILAFIRRKK